MTANTDELKSNIDDEEPENHIAEKQRFQWEKKREELDMDVDDFPTKCDERGEEKD